MKYMLLIYGDENALSETEREHCYEESLRLVHEIKAARDGLSLKVSLSVPAEELNKFIDEQLGARRIRIHDQRAVVARRRGRDEAARGRHAGGGDGDHSDGRSDQAPALARARRFRRFVERGRHIEWR